MKVSTLIKLHLSFNVSSSYFNIESWLIVYIVILGKGSLKCILQVNRSKLKLGLKCIFFNQFVSNTVVCCI